MMTPAQRHFLRAMAAAQAATIAEPNEVVANSSYQLMQLKLIEDKRRLKDIQSIERKINLKAELLPEYSPYVQGVIESDSGFQDDVLMTLFVWYVDVGEFATAINIADYALKHNLKPADQFQRSIPAILVEEAADYHLRTGLKLVWEKGEIQNPAREDLSQCLEQLLRIREITESSDMHDQARAKLYKCIGYFAALSGDHDGAIKALARALELDSNCGVKKDLERLEPKRKSFIDKAKSLLS